MPLLMVSKSSASEFASRLRELLLAQHSPGTLDPEDWRAQRELLKRLLQIDAYDEAYSFNDGAWNRHLSADVELKRAIIRVAAL